MKRQGELIGIIVLFLLLIITGCESDNGREKVPLLNNSSDIEMDKAISENVKSDKASALFAPVYLVDTEEISISVTDLTYDEMWGYKAELCIDNHTDNLLSCSIEDAYLNDLKTVVSWNPEISPRSKEYREAVFFVKPETIPNAGKLTFCWLIYIYGQNKKDYLVKNITDFYIKSEYEAYSYAKKESDRTVLEDDEISLYITDINTEGHNGYMLTVYGDNKGKSRIEVDVIKSTVNGIDIDVYGTFDLLPDMKGYSDIYWMNDDLMQAGIDDISEIKITVSVIDIDNFNEIDVIDYKITL